MIITMSLRLWAIRNSSGGIYNHEGVSFYPNKIEAKKIRDMLNKLLGHTFYITKGPDHPKYNNGGD